ncbi:MAG TPA: gamma-glutamyltransferase [Bacillota bacterium]|nr:gamma-glutamyltransferase [Bacillota bacterium]HOA15974.1 gamma-glutamyltransferase [Bacillota bacterium]HOG52493.1 gamma-glutamyltransferase [Bacillota bacterium]
MKRIAIAMVLAIILVGGMVASAAVDTHTPKDVTGKNGMVAAAHPLASAAGVEVLKAGGNAIDAAVATGLALNMVEPNASGIGGGGFMVIRFAKTGEVAVIDYREMAPGASTKDMYADPKAAAEKWTIEGGKSIGIPGTVAGYFMALEKFGTKTFKELAQPAIKLGKEGFEVSEMLAGIIKDNYAKMAKWSEPQDVPYFDQLGLPLEKGAILKNPQLAKVFEELGEKGKDAFYTGWVADAIVKSVQKAGGIMTKEDLTKYVAKMREPVRGTYRGYEIVSMPPPSSGGTHIIQMLNCLENYDVKAMGHNSVIFMHTFAEIMKLTFADRTAYMRDSDFGYVPVKGLISKDYAKTMVNQISPNSIIAAPKAGEPSKYESGNTTSFVVVDQEGNICCVTQTINYFFGSGVMAAGAGFMLNDEMDDFSTNPASVSAPEPYKRPLSSMSPTIVLKDGKPFVALGTPGATRIFPSIVQTLVNIIDHGMGMDEAIEAPRFWSNGPSVFAYEDRIDANLIAEIEKLGHKPRKYTSYDAYFGAVQGILFDQATGTMYGGADSRRLGEAIGF